MDEDLLTPDEVCQRLKVTKDWLYDRVEAGRIPYVRLGRHLRFSVGDLAAHIAEHSHPARHADSMESRGVRCGSSKRPLKDS